MIFVARPDASMVERTIIVEVVCATTEEQVLRRVRLSEGGTVMQAIEASGIRSALREGEMIDPRQLGVFSKKVTPDHVLLDGDRVEIYRPLLLDPMEARRRRAR